MHKMMTKLVDLLFLLLLLASDSGIIVPVSAIFVEDVGVLDYHWASSGHTATRFVYADSDDNYIITSDSPTQGYQLVVDESSTSCFVTSRHIDTGKIQWRRNVCSTPPPTTTTTTGTKSQQQSHTTTALPTENLWFSMDTEGVVRAWTMIDGALVWDTIVFAGMSTNQPQLTTLTLDDESFVVVMSNEMAILLDIKTGEQVSEPFQAQNVLGGGNKNNAQARWLGVVSTSNDNQYLIAAWVSQEEGVLSTTGSDMVAIQVVMADNNNDDDDFDLTLGDKIRLNHCKGGRISVSSLQFLTTSQQQQGVMAAVTVDGAQLMICNIDGSSNSNIVDWTNDIQSSWSRIKSIAAIPDTNALQVTGLDGEGMEIMTLWDITEETVLLGTSAARAVTMGCDSTIVSMQSNRFKVGSTSPSNEVDSSWLADDKSAFTMFAIVACNSDQLQVLVATTAGTTAVVQLSKDDTTKVQHQWTHHEGLGHISSALVLDSSHAVVVDDLAGDPNQEEKELAQRLSLTARLQSQLSSIMTGGSLTADRSTKDRMFGFYKMAVLVSESMHRLYGMSMGGENRGSVEWTVDLPNSAVWHKLVHGTSNSPKAIHGINGGTHAREVMVVSALEDGTNIAWQCIDGTHGDVHAEGSVASTSPVVQVVPLLGGGACRQHALLVHQDRSVSILPNEDSARESVAQLLETSENGFFAHAVVDSETTTPRLESLQVVQHEAAFTSRLVGQISFPGERIVRVVYPMRDEVVQSPCTVLGDDSLLLKYLNPHMAVMITVKDEDENKEKKEHDPFTAALKKAKKEADLKQKKKPMGVTPKGVKPDDPDSATAEPEPNLFVNVVDTVSGRILYRASHANAATSSAVRAAISENWVIYSFVSAKTRKTELGVLTLHEGMLHSKAITALTSPDQVTSFSSLDARESKPVVMAKTYSLPKAVTAMGVTNTKAGISSHQLLIATADDRIFGVERRMLDTRRPVGELKETEKQEGLRQYSEMIPLISLQSLSYNLTIHAPTAILSSPTELESQTIVLAYGGPDIFFTRTSPSKGFDTLPESFNRILLLILTFALLSAVFMTKKMATKKILRHGWM